ncbi:MAG: TetR/AcrR family transcriptional regulator [Chloroflexi bacterium]|nr:TetR/AcrR family transcriptional regulator [Chloroflexota bacterium]
MPKGIPRTKEELEDRRKEIAHAAADLIFDKGFTETSVIQIAKAAGMGKSSLYDYFPNKDEIILYLLDGPLTELNQRAEVIISGAGNVVERLRKVMKMHLDILLRNTAFILKVTLAAQRLNAESQQRYQIKRYAYQDRLQALIEEGIAQGSIRPINAAIAMKTLLAIMTPVVFTTRPVGSPEEMLDDALDIFLKGIQA